MASKICCATLPSPVSVSVAMAVADQSVLAAARTAAAVARRTPVDKISMALSFSRCERETAALLEDHTKTVKRDIGRWCRLLPCAAAISYLRSYKWITTSRSEQHRNMSA